MLHSFLKGCLHIGRVKTFKIISSVSSYLWQAGCRRQKNGFTKPHSFYNRQPKAFANAGKNKCFTILIVPEFFLLTDGTYHSNPAIYSKLFCFLQNNLLVRKVIHASQYQFIIIVA